MTLIGGPTLLIEAAGFRLVTDPTFDAAGEYQLSYVTLTKTSGPALAALALRSRLQMLEPGNRDGDRICDITLPVAAIAIGSRTGDRPQDEAGGGTDNVWREDATSFPALRGAITISGTLLPFYRGMRHVLQQSRARRR